MVKEGTHLELHCDTIEHLHHGMVHGVLVAGVVSKDQAVYAHYLVVGKPEQRGEAAVELQLHPAQLVLCCEFVLPMDG